jgi:hypothetical protein
MTNGAYDEWKPEQYTDYMYDRKCFIIIKGEQWVGIYNMDSGRHLMRSYDKESIKVDGHWPVNDAAGVEIPVLLLMWLKAKQMAHKYHWGQRLADILWRVMNETD